MVAIKPTRVWPSDAVDLGAENLLCDRRFNWHDVVTKRAIVETTAGPEGGGLRVLQFKFLRNDDVQENGENWLMYGGFGTGAHWYACTPRNLIKGARSRLFGVRGNDFKEHSELIDEQKRCVLRAGCKKFKKHFAQHLLSDKGHVERMKEWVEQPHPKRGLRRGTYWKNTRKGRLVIKDRRRYTDYKSKPGELLAAGKQLRAIGEISEESAFEHGPTAKLHKDIYALPFYYRCGVTTFIKGPTSEELGRAIQALLNPVKRVNHIYFSDDACLSVKCSDGLFLCNLDFKWSDGSMYRPAFEYARSVWTQDVLARDSIRSAFRQCRKPIRLINRSDLHGCGVGLKKRYKSYIEVPLIDGEYALPSGFSGTTLMNCNSQILWFTSFVDVVNRRALCTRAETEAYIKAAARRAGLQIKVDVCERVEDLQFLKHSWAMTDNGWQPYVNIGCWVRGYGYVDGHMGAGPRMDLTARVHQYTAEIVESRKNWGESSLSRVFKNAYPLLVHAKLNKHLTQKEVARSHLATNTVVTDEAICLRYRLKRSEWLDFVEFLATNLRPWVTLNHPVIGRIMEKDYGYKSESALPVDIQKRVPTFTYHETKRLHQKMGRAATR